MGLPRCAPKLSPSCPVDQSADNSSWLACSRCVPACSCALRSCAIPSRRSTTPSRRRRRRHRSLMSCQLSVCHAFDTSSRVPRPFSPLIFILSSSSRSTISRRFQTVTHRFSPRVRSRSSRYLRPRRSTSRRSPAASPAQENPRINHRQFQTSCQIYTTFDVLLFQGRTAR